MQNTLPGLFSILTVGSALTTCSFHEKSHSEQPNIVLIFLDDAGWGDFRPFMQARYATPNIDQLSREGCSFYNFYVPQAICSASRGALLTGCYPERTGLVGALPPGQRGLDPGYMTIGEALKKKDYKTAIFGKWHLGDQPDTRPDARGFDESCGLMYSNDMWVGHPENPTYWGKFPLKYWENGKVTIDSVTAEDQQWLTTWVTEKSVDFISRHKKQPFFLYVPHHMPHVPLFCSEKFRGKSGTGLYGDVIMEIDWSVGEIMKALKNSGLEQNTLVIFSSDNGPWISYGNHSGQTPFRGEKGTSFDGGIRSPLITKYPGTIEANTISFITFCSIDLFPVFCHLTGASLPEYEIDGENVWDLLTGKPAAQHPHEYYSISTNRNMDAIITSDGKWKLHVPHEYRCLIKGGKDGKPGIYEKRQIDLSLYDMVLDPYEKINVIEQYPEVAEKLERLAEEHYNKFHKSE